MKTISLLNRRFVTWAVAEVTAVPFFELYSEDLAEANRQNQVLFSQILRSVSSRSNLENVSFEFLFQSFAVDNQTYRAQVKLYFVIRRVGDSKDENERVINGIMRGIVNNMEDKNFSVTVYESDSEYAGFENNLNQANCEKILSVSKNENGFYLAYPGNVMYYNDAVRPSENVNTTSLINALSQNPGSLVSLQIIPAAYSDIERITIEQNKTIINTFVANMRYQQGFRIDANIQRIVNAYEYYSSSGSENVFLYNFLVYSDESSAVNLANILINSVEEEGATTNSALEIVDVTNFVRSCPNETAGTVEGNNTFSLSEKFYFSPWSNSDMLINIARAANWWNSPNAPVVMKRLRQIMTVSELKSVLKFPLDDNRIIGIDSNRIVANRERLHDSVISEGNFQVGIIQNTSRHGDESEAHAGIALDDFSKHCLIVGMPGSGKTNFSLGILLRFWRDFEKPFLVIEPTKTEYRSLIDEIDELQVFTPGKSMISPYIINPFIPPKGVTVESYVPSLMSAFMTAFPMPEPLPMIFPQAINDCYNEYGWKSYSTKDDPDVRPFGMYEFIKVFKKKIQRLDYKGDVKANMESAGVVRLMSLIEQNSTIYDTVNTIPLEDLLKKPTVIELNAINNKEQKSLIMALLLIMVCEYTKNHPSSDGALKNILMIDEAHVLLSRNSNSSEHSADLSNSTVEALENMIAEIRSYGTGVIIADQSPTKVGRNIIATTNVKVIFKLVEKENKDAISTATNMNDADYEKLGRLGVGEAMLHYGLINKPLHIKTYDIKKISTMRKEIDDLEVGNLTKYWDNNKELLIPHNECRYNCECKEECNLRVRYDADFIALRLINEYLYDINDKKTFVTFLVRMDRQIDEVLEENTTIKDSLKLRNCVKIKFLRKALLVKSFNLSNSEYKSILEHGRFILKE